MGLILSSLDRLELVSVARDGLAQGRFVKRANALVLLDDGHKASVVAKFLLLDEATIRRWLEVYRSAGLEGLLTLAYEGSVCRLDEGQQEAVVAFVEETNPASTSLIAQFIERRFDVSYSRSGLLMLLNRLGLVYQLPEAVPRHVDEQAQARFIANYEALLNGLAPDEHVVFIDAVHPTRQARRSGVWVRKGTRIVLPQASGRERLNLHGAINLETGQTQILETEVVNAASTIALLEAIVAAHPKASLIHVPLDQARYHHAKAVKDWLKASKAPLKLHFLPPYCPHLNPIERLWAVMHQNITHNKPYNTFKEFRQALLIFLKHTIPKNWTQYADQITDNFRIISLENARILK
jgi:transposase